MLVRFAAHQAAIIAAVLFVLPGHEARQTERLMPPAAPLAPLIETAPSGTSADSQPAGLLSEKWRAVRERMSEERRLVALCRADPAICPSDAATFFMAIVDAARPRDGRAQIGEINRSINLAVRPVPDDARHGADVWTSPLATLASGQGDCEDYAIAKLAALWSVGIAESDTRLVIVHDARTQEDHALAMVRLDGRWLALDNRRFTLIAAEHLSYRPLFAIGGDRVQAFGDSVSWAALDDLDGTGLSARRDTAAPGAGRSAAM